MLGPVVPRRRMPGELEGELVDVAWTCAEGQAAEPKWVRIAVEGTWKGHPKGPFRLTRGHFEQMVANHERGGRDLAVDYEHAGSIPGLEAPAAGWLKGLRQAQTEAGQAALEGLLAWNERARQQIAAGEYRFLSPGFDLDFRDKHTGKRVGARLSHVALTNRPFIDELPPLSLREAEGLTDDKERNMEEHLQQIAQKLGLAADAAPEAVLGKVGELVQLAEQREAAIRDIHGALELGETAGPRAAVGAIMRLRNPQAQATAQEVRELREKLAQREAREAVAAAQADGKVTGDGTDQHAWAMTYALKDPAGFEEWAKAAPVVVPLRRVERPRGRVGAPATELTEYQGRLCSELGITKEQYLAEQRAEQQ